MRSSLGLVSALITANLTFAIEVASFEAFDQAVKNEVAVITLADSFAFQDSVIISHDCTITASQPVTLDLQGNYIKVIGSHFEMGTSEHTIICLNGAPNLRLEPCCTPLTAYLINCQFNWSQNWNGVNLRAAHPIDAEFINCAANYNAFDGFNLHNKASHQGDTLVIFDHCEAIGNDPNGIGGSRGDGITAHAANHHFVVIGGRYNDNSKSGAAMVYGSNLSVEGDAVFAGNGWAGRYIGDVFLTGFGELTWDQAYCTLMTLQGDAFFTGGIVERLDYRDGFIELFGIDISGVPAIGYDACLRPMRVPTETYTSHAIPIPGDSNQDGHVSPQEAMIELDTPSGQDDCDVSTVVRTAVMQRICRDTGNETQRS